MLYIPFILLVLHCICKIYSLFVFICQSDNLLRMRARRLIVGICRRREKQNDSKRAKSGREQLAKGKISRAPHQNVDCILCVQITLQMLLCHIHLRPCNIKTVHSYLWAGAAWWVRGQDVSLDVTFNHGGVPPTRQTVLGSTLAHKSTDCFTKWAAEFWSPPSVMLAIMF